MDKNENSKDMKDALIYERIVKFNNTKLQAIELFVKFYEKYINITNIFVSDLTNLLQSKAADDLYDVCKDSLILQNLVNIFICYIQTRITGLETYKNETTEKINNFIKEIRTKFYVSFDNFDKEMQNEFSICSKKREIDLATQDFEKSAGKFEEALIKSQILKKNSSNEKNPV